MKIISHIVVVAILLGFGLSGCTTQQTLTDQALSQQYPVVDELSQKLETARSNNLPVLSPALFSESENAYNESLTLARADNPKATSMANQGLQALTKANANAVQARDVLEEVLKARDKAVSANAAQMNAKGYAEAENGLLGLTRAMEQGKIEQAKAGRADVMRAYGVAELAAVKDSTLDQARDAIARAKKNDVDDKAPKTFQLANEEYNLALRTLEANRMQTEKASIHANKAVWHIQRANEIADIMTNFETSDFNEEDKILWYQDQISRMVQPLTPDVAFNQPNKVLVKDINSRISQLQSDYQQAELALGSAQSMQAQLAQEKSDELQAVKELSESEKRRQKAFTAKFSFIQALYKANEAEVYRQNDNVLIRAHGFAFRTGDSEIDATNFALMNKVIESLSQFPNAKIVVSGHTDNQGGDKINLSLSQERAQNVAEFLTQVGRIPAQRIEVIGYGKAQPVANNDSDEGRAANRRVEILIVNS